MNGSVVASVRDDKGQPCSLTILHRGTKFGEESLLANTNQKASIISHTDVELLVATAEDFEAIFMAEGVKKILGSDYENFLGNIPFLRGWPVSKLFENSSSCMFRSFNAGQVIVKDSNDSDWIYIVKSGSISVMKKLTQVKPRKSVHYERQLSLAKRGINVTMTFKERRQRRKLLVPLALPDVSKPKFHTQLELQMKMDATIPGAYKENDRLGILDYDTIFSEYRDQLYMPQVAEMTSHLEDTIELKVTDKAGGKRCLNEFGGPPVLPAITKTRAAYLLSRGRSTQMPSDGDLSDPGDINEDIPTPSIRRKESLIRLPEIEASVPQEAHIPAVTSPDMVSPSITNNIFILVQVLEKGQYFGVGDVVFRETQPSLSLVSNGAECLLLSKSFFRQHSTETIINDLRRTEVPYPSDSELQQKLQEDTDWRSYRAEAYRQLVLPLINAKARRRQYTGNNSWQYNFRSGPT